MTIEKQLAEELFEVSAELRNSSAYNVFQHVDLGRLLPDTFGRSSHVSALTVDSVINHIVNHDTAALALNASQIKALTELLSKLMDVHHPTEPEVNNRENESVINSVQLEATLRENLGLVSQHPRYADIADKTLSEFWDETWLPAPFEEMLTIRQLTGMDLSVLFKKKMVSDTRISCIAKALETAHKSVESSGFRVVQQPVYQQPVYGEDSKASLPPPPVFYAETLEQQALLELVTLHHRTLCSSSTASFVDKLFEALTPDQLLLLPSQTTVLESVEKKIGKLLQEHFTPEALEHAGYLLQGPGVSLQMLASVLMGRAQPFNAVSGFVAVAVARGLGAEPVDYKGVRNPRFWTVNLRLLRSVIETPDLNKRKTCSHLDPILHSWCRSHGGAGKKRTDTRKKLISRGRKRG